MNYVPSVANPCSGAAMCPVPYPGYRSRHPNGAKGAKGANRLPGKKINANHQQERRALISWAQRLKRVFNIVIAMATRSRFAHRMEIRCLSSQNRSSSSKSTNISLLKESFWHHWTLLLCLWYFSTLGKRWFMLSISFFLHDRIL